MNELEKESFYTFSPKLDRRLGGDRKTTGNPSVIKKQFSLTSNSRVKNFLPKMTAEGKTSGIQRFLKNFSLTSNSR